jgi:hypothetical protein
MFTVKAKINGWVILAIAITLFLAFFVFITSQTKSNGTEDRQESTSSIQKSRFSKFKNPGDNIALNNYAAYYAGSNFIYINNSGNDWANCYLEIDGDYSLTSSIIKNGQNRLNFDLFKDSQGVVYPINLSKRGDGLDRGHILMVDDQGRSYFKDSSDDVGQINLRGVCDVAGVDKGFYVIFSKETVQKTLE